MAEVNEILKSEKKPLIPPIKINEDVNLPYGFGFDDVIQEKIEKLDSKNFKSEKLMDKLADQLSQADYRDQLAINKYMLEVQ